MKVLLSIKPEFVEKIFSEEKKYEFRKVIFKKDIDTVIIYSTMPEGKIVGEFQIEDVLHDDLESIWQQTSQYAGISYDFFKEYFSNKEQAYAIKIGEVIRYETPIDPKMVDKTFIPPQSFCYTDKEYA
ncbi:ASCH domain-containing protein [Brevibacillus sp. H7]|uniref:ASCH domain-containing protein n=1 Tax=Brevibacillus sp. H7 TaxID=3349138 RepID=UPI00380BC2AC